MDSNTIPLNSAAASSADLAKAALRRLVMTKLEPTPENFARAFRAEAGHAGANGQRAERVQALLERIVAGGVAQAEPGVRRALVQALFDGQWDQVEREFDGLTQGQPAGAALADLFERVTRGLERGGRQWTGARRKESLQRVLAGSRLDAHLLQRRLVQLVASWESDTVDGAEPAARDEAAIARPDTASEASPPDAAPRQGDADWAPVVARLVGSLRTALAAQSDTDQKSPAAEPDRAVPGPELLAAAAALGDSVQRALGQRDRLVAQLTGLCVELTDGLADVAEEDEWARGQLATMRQTLESGLTSRGVRAAGELLRKTREQQARLRDERAQARDALKGLINQMLGELGDLGSHTGRFEEKVGRYAEVIDQAESLESLTGVVGDMLAETRSVQALVGQTQTRLQAEHARATALSDRVTELESELRRLADEVSTDQLTQVANRRGLLQAFETVRAQSQRDGQPLAIGLLDVDNFKRLNDELGHSAGDVALRSLAGLISKSLRPGDVVARFGGEEFVVLLPATGLDDAAEILTRLQRSLSVGLFMHERKTVFVTFSAGVTLLRQAETLEQALERSDAALYEAKRTGKNRTCLG